MSRFADYTTSIAFHITLSRQMVDLLVGLLYAETLTRGPEIVIDRLAKAAHVSTMGALHRRGLVEISITEPLGQWSLTTAGKSLGWMLIHEGIADYPAWLSGLRAANATDPTLDPA